MILIFVWIAFSSMETARRVNGSKMEELFHTYSNLQVLERMYNNYYRSTFWPALVQVGTLTTCFPVALCMSKWHILSKDPRVLLLFICILNGFIACILGPYFASKVNTGSRLLLKHQSRVFSNTYIRKRTLSKPNLNIKIADNFIDVKFPLTVSMFCVNNVFSLLIILKQSK